MASFVGTDGNDLIIGGQPGDENYVDGKDGEDTLDYSGLLNVSLDVEFLNGEGAAGTCLLCLRGEQGIMDYFRNIENVRGTAESDYFYAGGDLDTLGNVIDGGGGDDSVYTGGGNDTLIGGPGQDYLDGGLGFDTADYYDSPQRVTLLLAHTDSWGVGEEPGTTDQVARQGGGDAEGDTLQGIEKVATSQFDDLVFGFDTGTWADLWNGNDTFDNTQDMDAEDHIFGGYGNDRIWTGAGNDSLYGEWGNDSLFGEDGNDLLDGGSENDSLTGGNGGDSIVGDAGNDTFVYNDVEQSAPAYGFDKIYGFDNPGPAAGDVIDLGAIDPFPSTAQDEAFIWAGELSADPETAKAQQQWGAVWVFDHEWDNSTMVQGWTEGEGNWFQFWIFDGPNIKAANYTADDFVL